MLDQHRRDAYRQGESDLKDIAGDAHHTKGIIAFIARVATMSAAPMKPMISKYFMTPPMMSVTSLRLKK
jgi:hypothetical protein